MRKLSLADKLRASGGARVWTQVVWYLQHDSYEFVQWNSSYSNSDIVHQACVLINCFLGKWLKLGSHRKFHKGYMWILLGMQVDKVSLLPQVTKHHLLKKYLIMAEGINDALTILKRKIHDVQTHSIQKPRKNIFFQRVCQIKTLKLVFISQI